MVQVAANLRAVWWRAIRPASAGFPLDLFFAFATCVLFTRLVYKAFASNQRSGSTSGFDRRACPRAGLTYSGKIRFIQRNLLRQAIARTHGGRLPETGPVFVEVRVALPTGLALAEHSKSKVQFSLPNSDPPRFTLKIANWPNGVPEFWRQPAFMDFIR